jgi:hypothetical protein
MNFDATDYAWAAGFMDGEGCFTLSNPARTARDETVRTVIVSATQVRPDPLMKLSAMFSAGTLRPTRTALGRKSWEWRGRAELARTMIPLILPYLVLKRREAEIVLGYAETVCYRGRSPVPEFERAMRLSLIVDLDAIRATR